MLPESSVLNGDEGIDYILRDFVEGQVDLAPVSRQLGEQAALVVVEVAGEIAFEGIGVGLLHDLFCFLAVFLV